MAGEQGSKVWIVCLTLAAQPGDLFLDVKYFDRWRAVELIRTRPFTAANKLCDALDQSVDMSLSVSSEWPETCASLSLALSGQPAELEVVEIGTASIDADGDGVVSPDEFQSYLAANRTVRLGAEFVRVSGVVLHHKGEAKAYKGINGDYQRSQEVSNGRAVYVKVSKPSTAMWWTNNDGKLSWGNV